MTIATRRLICRYGRFVGAHGRAISSIQRIHRELKQMCGIAGLLRSDAKRADSDVLARMIHMVAHRGPDASGTYTDGPVGFAHSRLSIIDLEGGQQPMTTADGRFVITFNGEIFNYLELRKELIAKGRRFQTRSDTEVILNLYAEYGEDCVHRMNGQWAFAIWDRQRQRLFLSRDRLGIRPLFYTQLDSGFVFGSEVKVLFAHPEVPRAIDPVGLDQLFTFWSPLPGRTVFRNVHELPPGHSMTVQGTETRLSCYWRPDYQPSDDTISPDEYAERLLDLLVDAVRLRLRADVPVGAYLSGGLDSSLTTALIKGFTNAPLSTFSVSFDDGEYDESRFQQDVVRDLNTDHRSIRCSNNDIGRVFPQVIDHTEKPVLRTAPAPLLLLSQLVRSRGYKVVVTGEGADEMFGGYDIFKEAKIRRFWARQPESNVRPRLLSRLYPYMPALQSQPDAYLRSFFRVGAEDLASPFFSHLPRWRLTSQLKMFFSPELRRELRQYDAMAEFASLLPSEFAGWHPFCQAQYLETTNLLPGYILSSQGDRMAMANSIEGRFPFLDHRVVEFAARVPLRLKMRGLDEKHLLKRVARNLVPESVRQRPKQPYRAPDAASFFDPATGAARADYVEDMLAADRIAEDGLFNPSAVDRLVKKVRSGRAIGTKDNMALVGILSTQLVMYQLVRHSKRCQEPFSLTKDETTFDESLVRS